MQVHDTAAVAALIDPALAGPGMRQSIETMESYFPRTAPRRVELVDRRPLASPIGSVYEIALQYAYAKKWMFAQVIVRDRLGGSMVEGMHVVPMPASLESLNAFFGYRRPPLYWAILAAAVAVWGFVGATLNAIVRTKIRRLKWLWFVFALLGVTGFVFNWTTGQWIWQPLMLVVPGAWLGHSFGMITAQVNAPAQFQPWVLNIGLPVGAIVFWVRRRSLAYDAPLRGGFQTHQHPNAVTIRGEFGGGAGVHDAAAVEHVGAIGDAQREQRVLLDE